MGSCCTSCARARCRTSRCHRRGKQVGTDPVDLSLALHDPSRPMSCVLPIDATVDPQATSSFTTPPARRGGLHPTRTSLRVAQPALVWSTARLSIDKGLSRNRKMMSLLWHSASCLVAFPTWTMRSKAQKQRREGCGWPPPVPHLLASREIRHS